MNISIERPTVASLFLAPFVNGQRLGSATGFVVLHEDRPFLITNRHVATGRHQQTGKPLHESTAVPTELRIAQNVQGKLGEWRETIEPLYQPNDSPRWHEHPEHGEKVDVIALPLTDVDGVELYPYDPWNPGPALAFGVSGQLSIVGFPFGLTGGGAMAIWVQGTVASEPQVDFDGLPAFLIDSRTRQGQSGSPVIIFQRGGAVAMDHGGVVVGGGPQARFVGVYSGRINEQSDLGFVWKAEAVAEILDAV